MEFKQKEYDEEWECQLFGSEDFIYTPVKGKVPNGFIRYMMGLCLGCKWVKKEWVLWNIGN